MKWLLAAAALFVLSVSAWIFMNPLKGFGISRPGLTTYDLVPIPWADFQVRADGSIHWAAKSDTLSLDDAAPMLDPKPDVLIIATGWKGRQRARPEIAGILQGYDVHVVKTGEALDLYNRFLADKKRVAIRVRSDD